MKISIFVVLSTMLLISCQETKKAKAPEKEVQIQAEIKVLNDSTQIATVTTISVENGEETIDENVIIGTPGEVQAKLEQHKVKMYIDDTSKGRIDADEESNKEIKVKMKVAFQLNSKSGSTATGKVVFTEENGMVTMEADIMGLTPGIHAIHIHEKADCSAENGKSAGGHWNPTHDQHGKWGNETGYHRGDIGNFTADKEGKGSVTFSTDLWCLSCADETKNLLGKAVIVHQGEDDFVSQPSGAAGARISCAGIIK